MKYALLPLLLLCSIAMAGGGKVRDANPIIGDGCIYQVPPGLDLSRCEILTAPSQSGVVYLCDMDDVLVLCSDAED